MATLVKNKFKCPSKLWRKMGSEKAHRIYNEVMEQTLKNQGIISHPKMPEMPDEQWHTLCHNFAYFAVCAYRDDSYHKGDIVIDINDRTGKEVRRRKFA